MYHKCKMHSFQNPGFQSLQLLLMSDFYNLDLNLWEDKDWFDSESGWDKVEEC